MKKTSAACLVLFAITAFLSSVKAQTPTLTQAWAIGTNTITPLRNDSNCRSIAYNPFTGNLLFASRTGSNGVHCVNAVTGAQISPSFNMGSSVIVGGSLLAFSVIAVADDGAIYAVNVTDPTGANPLKLYRWDNESSSPVNVYSGNGGGVPTGRYGDTFTVRGSGTSTEILVGSDKANLVRLTTSSAMGINGSWTAQNLAVSGVAANLMKSALSFLPGNQFVAKTRGSSALRISFNPGAGTGAFVATLSSTVVPTAVSGLSLNQNYTNLMGGVSAATSGSLTNYLWDIVNPSSPSLKDNKTLPTANTDAGNGGASAWGGGRLYAMSVNNGIVAYDISTMPRVTTQPTAGQTVTSSDSAIMTIVAANTATYQWRHSGTNISNGGNISGATTASLTVNPAKAADAGNYTVVLLNGATNAVSAVSALTVNKTNQTITFGGLGGKTYGDAAFGVSATSSSGLTVTFSIASGPATITGGTNVNLTGAGTVVVRASQAGDADYNAASDVDQSFSVAKAALTVTAINTNIYGSEPTLTPTYVGFLSGDNAGNSLTGTPNLSATTTTNSTVAGGPYAITVTLGTLASDDYDLTASDGDLTVIPATLVVSANNTNRLYATSNPTFTESYTGFVNNEDATVLTGGPNLTTTATTGSPAGNYSISVGVGSLAADNYSFSFVSGTLAVNKAALTVTMDDTNRVYGATNLFTATYTGFINGDDASAVSGTPNFTTTADTNSPVSGNPYTVTPSLGTLSATSYDFTTFVPGTLTITQAPLVVTAGLTKVYGATNPPLEPAYVGFVNGEDTNVLTGNPILSTSVDTNSTVAGSPYVVTVMTNDLASPNYAIIESNGAFAVIAATLTVTAENTNRVYGATNPDFTASYSGFMNSEDTNVLTGSPSLTTTATTNSAVGGHTITAAVGTLSANNDNYNFSFVDGTITVTKAALIVTTDDTNRVYGATNPAFTVSYSGFVNGEDLGTSGVTGSPSFSTDATTNSSVVGSPYFVTNSLGTLSAANYDFTSFVPGTLTVTAAGLTITSDGASRAYGASDPAFTGSLVGIQNNDNITATYSTIADTNSVVGGYAITQTLTDPDTKLANYTVTTNNGTLTVTGAVLTVTAENTNRVYGATNPDFTASYSGFVNSEDTNVLMGSPSLTTTATTNSAVGGHTITAAVGTLAANDGNYTFSFVDGTMSVTKAALTITTDNTNRVYGATNPAFTVSYNGFVNGEDLGTSGVTGSPSFSTDATTNSPVSGNPYTVTPSLGTLGATSYDFTTFVPGTLTITQAPLVVTAGLTKVYGATNPPLEPAYLGFVNGEDTNVLTGNPILSTIVDTNSTVAGSPYVVTVVTNDLASPNYSIIESNGTFAVTAATLTVTAENTNRVYGATNPDFTASYSGFVNSEDTNVLTGSPSLTTTATTNSAVGGHTITAAVGTLSANNDNYIFNFVDGTMTITEAVLTITSESTNRIYGATNPVFTGSVVGLQNNDNITATYGTTATTNSGVGSYTISQSLIDLDTKLGNYAVITNDGSMSVTAAALTVTVDDASRGEGEENPVFTGTILGIQNNDNITATYSSDADTNGLAGTYDIYPEFVDPDLKLVNYSVTTNLGTLTVDGPPGITAQPVSLTIGAGTNAVFTVVATGSSLNYHWKKGVSDLVDGGNISGATSASLTLSGVSQSDAATNYTVFITNASSSNVTSDAVSLTVIDPPAILVDPSSRTNVAGTTASFSASANGTAPLHYQWQFEGVDLPAEVFTNLSLINVEEINAGNYTIVITNAAGSVTSAPAVLSVYYTLTAAASFGGVVSKSPDESSYAPGASVDLTATANPGFVFTGWSGDASGTSNPLTVVVSANKSITGNFMGPGGDIILDNTNTNVTFVGAWITNNQASGRYGADYNYALVTNGLVTATATYRPEIPLAGNYDIYVWYPQLSNRSTNSQWLVSYDGGGVTASVNQKTNGGGWRLIASEKPFAVGTNGFVRLSNSTSEAGTNTFVIADAVRFVHSGNQGTAPIFVTEPVSQSVNQSSNATFTVSATGTGTLIYQWRFNNEPIAGATGTSYTRTNVQAVHTGNYSVCVMHDTGSATSSNAVLSVNLPPTITAQPTNKTVVAGQSYTFNVTATGTAPLTYQWQFNSNNISGATSSSYLLASSAETNEGYYSVAISNAASVVMSLNAFLTVNPDSTNPTVSFLSPAVGRAVTNAIITMTGKAKDNIRVAAVKYLFEGITNTATGTTNWSAILTLTPGTNVVIAWSIDASDHESARVTNKFYYNSTDFLDLNINGSGQVSGVTDGQGLLVGRSYSATASIGAGTNYVFTNWTGTTTATNKTLAFVMQSNMVLNANFIPNPFSPVAGKYNGLFFETTNASHQSAGFFALTLSSKASYTGKLVVDGNTIPMSGKFDLSGRASRTLSRSKFGKSTLNLSLELDWSTTNETIHGTVSDGVWTADLFGDRATYNVNFNPATNFLGRYTILIPVPTNGPINAPGGYGYALVTNTSAGMIKISKGALGDGAVLSQSVPISKFGHWPLYVPAYKNITRYTNGLIVTTNLIELRGSVIGWITFTNAPARTLMGTVDWIKTAIDSTNAFYAAGFTNRLELIGSGYVAPSAGTRLLTVTNATVVLQEGNLIAPLTNNIFIKTNNTVIVADTNNVLKVSFDARTGLLKGSFAHPDNTNKITSFTGAVLQDQNYGAGWFLGTNQSGAVRLNGY